MVVAGSCITAPTFTLYNIWIDRRLPAPTAGGVSPIRVWLPKLALETIFVAPFYMGVLVAYNRMLDPAGVITLEAIRNEATQLYIDGLKVCPWYQAVNFAIIPLNYRVQWQQGCAFFWNAYISYFLQQQKVMTCETAV